MTVTDITQQKKNPNRYNVFIDGEFYCGLNDETVVCFSIKKGRELTGKELDEIILEDGYSSALARGLEYAARTSGKSRRDFEDKLNEYPEQAVQRVIERLEELGYINDEELAHQIVARGIEKGEGPLMLRQRLIQKRISNSVVENALNISDDIILQAAEKCKNAAVEKYGIDDVKQRAKVYAAMQRKGFTYDVINDALSDLDD